jgi:hypothetical protein
MLLADVLADLAHLPISPVALIALVMATAAVVAVAVLAAHAVGTSRTSALPRVATLREKSWRVPGRAGVLRQRDPDSAGHSRPRAPSAAPAAASC